MLEWTARAGEPAGQPRAPSVNNSTAESDDCQGSSGENAFPVAQAFSEAVETAGRALSLAFAEGNTPLADDLRSQSKLYRAGTPLRQAEPLK